MLSFYCETFPIDFHIPLPLFFQKLGKFFPLPFVSEQEDVGTVGVHTAVWRTRGQFPGLVNTAEGDLESEVRLARGACRRFDKFLDAL